MSLSISPYIERIIIFKNQLILLGDSVIDNNSYVHGHNKPVTSHLKEILPEWSIYKRARDGATIEDVINFQTNHLDRSSPTVLSAGGNNLLRMLSIVRDDRKMTFNQSVKSLKPLIEQFESDYDILLSRLSGSSLCFTIYNPAFIYYDDTGFMSPFQKACEVTVNLFNDVIQRLVKRRGFDLLELRDLMTEKTDYANSIEPSHIGGKKIATSISRWLKQI